MTYVATAGLVEPCFLASEAEVPVEEADESESEGAVC